MKGGEIMPEVINEKTMEITRIVSNQQGKTTETIGAVPQETGIYTTEDGRVIEVNITGLEKGAKRAKSINIGIEGITNKNRDVCIGRNSGQGMLTLGTGDRLVVQLNDRSLLRKPRRTPLRGL